MFACCLSGVDFKGLGEGVTVRGTGEEYLIALNTSISIIAYIIIYRGM